MFSIRRGSPLARSARAFLGSFGAPVASGRLRIPGEIARLRARLAKSRELARLGLNAWPGSAGPIAAAQLLMLVTGSS